MEVVVLSKAPVPGWVKTRLARRVGREAAARLYRSMAERVVATLTGSGFPVTVAGAPGIAHPFFRQLRRCYGTRLIAQPPGDLGARMLTLLRDAGGEEPRALVGADCIGLGAGHLQQAAAALEAGAHAAFAPVPDGGYALVAARAPDAALFRAVPWGTGRVQTVTRQRARAAGLGIRWTDPAWDVDTPADLRRAGVRPVLLPRLVVSCADPAGT